MTRRFWSAAVYEAAAGGFRILLDGKTLRLPGGNVLVLRHAALAQAVATEWQQAGGAKGGTFSQADIPLTGLAGSAQDRIAPQVPAMVDTLARYAENDLLCYRVAPPLDLATMQATQWQPWLDWAATRYDAPLVVTKTIAHAPQPALSLERLRAALATRSIEHLAALGLAIPALGSCVLGLALAESVLTAETARDLACVDELYQERLWGADPATAARRTQLGEDLILAVRFIQLTRDEPARQD